MDLISKKALIDSLEKEQEIYENNNASPSFWTALSVVRHAPTVEAVPVEFICDVLLNKYKTVHGEWIAQDEGLTRFKCSVCNGKNYGGHEKFCPNCGADMRSEK